MAEIEFKVVKNEIADFLREAGVSDRKINRALVSAVNDTSRQVRTRVSGKIRERVAIKKRDIDKHIKLQRATSVPVAGVILSESDRLSLKYFGAKQLKKGVTYKIEKGGKRKRITEAFGPHPKEISRLGGHVFKRIGKKRLPIRQLFGVSPWGAFVKADLEGPTEKEADALLENNVNRRLNLLRLKLTGEVK